MKVIAVVSALAVLFLIPFVYSLTATPPELPSWTEQVAGVIFHITGVIALALVCITMALCTLASSGVTKMPK